MGGHVVEVTSEQRAVRRRVARRKARKQGGVLARKQLARLGWTRWQIRAELGGGRWSAHGRQTVATHTGALSEVPLLLALCVQQRLVPADQLGTEFTTVRRHPRRRFLQRVLTDLAQGAHSVGELEFARLCRDAGLPEPDRQVPRRGPHGTFYLDTEWSQYGVVVEIEGIHHLWADQAMADASRQNEITLQNSKVLRIPVVGLRLSPDHYLDQLRRLLHTAGWSG